MDTHLDAALRTAFRQGAVQLFVGSGLSIGYYPSAEEFKNRLLRETIFDASGKPTTLINLPGVDSNGISLEDVAEYFELYVGSNTLTQIIQQTFGEKKPPSTRHQRLWQLPNIECIYTTNFDCLIEDSLFRRQPPEVITKFNSSIDIDKTRRMVFKIHGCARKSRDRTEFVITRKDYLEYTHRKPLEALTTLLGTVTKTFLFLGYSLKDINMRHIMHEANNITSGKIRAYAVVKDAAGPEVEYWKRLGVQFIKADVDEFLDDVFKEFPFRESEWESKIEQRIDEKCEIARKAITELKEKLREEKVANVILDAGSTCFFLAKELINEISNNTIEKNSIRIITNSPPIIAEISKAMRHQELKQVVPLFSVGGELRYHTQAFAPNIEQAKSQLASIKSLTQCNKTFAFIGVAAIDEHGLKTRTRFEGDIKKAFIEFADEVYILADHSKHTPLEGGSCFWNTNMDKMAIITDSLRDLDELCPFFKRII